MNRITNSLPRRLHFLLHFCIFCAVACQSTPSTDTESADALVDDRDNCLQPISEWATGRLVAPYDWGAELFSITPYFAKGEFEGYRISPGADAKQFADSGLEPHDLLTKIEGVPVTLCQGAMSAEFENLRSGRSIAVTVLRGRDFSEKTISLMIQP